MYVFRTQKVYYEYFDQKRIYQQRTYYLLIK